METVSLYKLINNELYKIILKFNRAGFFACHPLYEALFPPSAIVHHLSME